MLKQQVFVEKTSKYISISSYWIGRISLLNTEQVLRYLEANVSFYELGVALKEKLDESTRISEDFFIRHFNDDEGLLLFNQNEEKKVVSIYGYKNAKAICKDALYLTISLIDNALVIRPSHQDGLGTFTTAKNKEGKGIEFEYSVGLSNEELGKAVMEAFEYCTSIYKKK